MKEALSAHQHCLRQAAEFLETLPSDVYRRPEPSALGSSVGDHFRHILDHYTALLEGWAGGRIDYENRRRDPAVSASPELARSRLLAQTEALSALTAAAATPVLVRGEPGDLDTGSTLARELNFVLSHTVHHLALVAFMVRAGGRETPPGFGVAPSTLRHLASPACAQ